MRGSIDGLILRETVTGESDKLLTVLTAEHGRIFLRAKGVRSVKSKNLSLCRIFTYGNFEYYEKGGMRWLAGGSVNDAFFGLDADIEGLSLASYVVDIASEISGEGVRADELLRVTLNTLYAISRRLKPYSLIKGAYEIYAATLSGFAPDLSSCAECGRAESDTFYLDVMNGSLCCSECFSGRSRGTEALPETDVYLSRNIFFPLSVSVRAAARYVMGATPARIFAFELEDEEQEELSRMGETYLQNHLERGFETLNFFKSIYKKL